MNKETHTQTQQLGSASQLRGVPRMERSHGTNWEDFSPRKEQSHGTEEADFSIFNSFLTDLLLMNIIIILYHKPLWIDSNKMNLMKTVKNPQTIGSFPWILDLCKKWGHQSTLHWLHDRISLSCCSQSDTLKILCSPRVTLDQQDFAWCT